MLTLLASMALALAKVPAPKFGYERDPASQALFQFEVDVFEIMKRAQLDPDYASVDLDNYDFHATFYFKGDAKAHLARYTSDPRIEAVSAPLSLAELTALSRAFRAWMERRGFKWEGGGVDARTSTMSVGSYEPERLRDAARQDGLDMTRIGIYDLDSDVIVPERG